MISEKIMDKSHLLEIFNGERFDGVMEFMRAVQWEGFTDEFDNSLIMRSMWTKYGELQQSIGKSNSSTYLTTKTEPNQHFGTVLKVTLHSAIVEGASVTLDLFIRDSRLVVSTNVLLEEVKPKNDKSEVQASGVYWFEAEKSFKGCPHFDNVALKAFRAVYRALAPKGDDVAIRLQITPLQRGWRVEYRLHGTKIFVSQFEFSK